MGSFMQPNEVEGFRNHNSRLAVENNELRKMMGLMQENLELRFALRDHETHVRSFSPPAPLSPPSPKEKMKEADRRTSHCLQDVSRFSNYQGRGRHMGGLGVMCLSDSDESGKMCMKGYKSSDSSAESYAEKHNEGHRKLASSLTKIHGENKDACYGQIMERMMSKYK